MDAKHVRHFDPVRLAALTHAVFAIVLTLLVLELKPPDGAGGDLPAALREAVPKIEAWAISFVCLGVFWVIHHNILVTIPRTDTAFNYLNLALLMCISIIPWTSALLGSYQDPLAVVLFSGMLGLAGLVMLVQWRYASGSAGLTSEEIDSNGRRQVTLLLARVPVVALLSMALAFVHRSLGLWVWLLIGVLGALIRARHNRRHFGTPDDADKLDVPLQTESSGGVHGRHRR